MQRRTFLKTSAMTLGMLLIPKEVMALYENSEADTSDQKSAKPIYITVDDGPRHTMKEMLDYLGSANKVTFFMVGENLTHPKLYALASRALQEGHSLGNHSFDHPRFSSAPIDTLKESVEKTHALIDRLYSQNSMKNPLLFRFPYGDPGFQKVGDKVLGSKYQQEEISGYLHSLGYTSYFWNSDFEDWKFYKQNNSKPLNLIIREKDKVKEEDIVLLHDIPITVQYVLPAILDEGEFISLALPKYKHHRDPDSLIVQDAK